MKALPGLGLALLGKGLWCIAEKYNVEFSYRSKLRFSFATSVKPPKKSRETEFSSWSERAPGAIFSGRSDRSGERERPLCYFKLL